MKPSVGPGACTKPIHSAASVTDLEPDYYPEGLFEKGIPHKITVIKKPRGLFMRIQNAEQTYHCHMTNPDLPAIEKGRIGLRHMYTRSSRYKNFRVSTTCPNKCANHESLVKETHQASLRARERVLRDTVARNTSWPNGVWGEVLWSLAALYLNEKADDANARLLKRAKNYIARHKSNAEISKFAPEEATETPWAYFALTDCVRILCLFHANSTHFPGRLTPETESVIKEALWLWVKSESKVVDASLENLLVLLGTENHDLTRRPNYYLISSILKDDPAFRNRRYTDREVATPADFDQQTDTSRILIHAGSVKTHSSLEQFRKDVLSSHLVVTPSKVEYHFKPRTTQLVATLFDVDDVAGFTLPTVNGKPIDLRPATTWQSPYLNGKFGGSRVFVTVGPVKQVPDFDVRQSP